MSEEESLPPRPSVDVLLDSIVIACVTLETLKAPGPKRLLKEAIEDAAKHLRPPTARIIAVVPKPAEVMEKPL